MGHHIYDPRWSGLVPPFTLSSSTTSTSSDILWFAVAVSQDYHKSYVTRENLSCFNHNKTVSFIYNLARTNPMLRTMLICNILLQFVFT